MGIEVVAMGATYLASVLAFGTFMWRVYVKMFEQFGARIDQQFVHLDERLGLVNQRIDDRFETLDRKIDDRFETLDRKIDENIQLIDAKVAKLDGKVDELAKDHQSLARQLAEFRGELRGRLGEPTPPGPQQAPA